MSPESREEGQAKVRDSCDRCLGGSSQGATRVWRMIWRKRGRRPAGKGGRRELEGGGIPCARPWAVRGPCGQS